MRKICLGWLFAFVFSVLTGCLVINTSHCAYLIDQGAESNPCDEGLVCNKCKAENNGCAPPGEVADDCLLGVTTGQVSDTMVLTFGTSVTTGLMTEPNTTDSTTPTTTSITTGLTNTSSTGEGTTFESSTTDTTETSGASMGESTGTPMPDMGVPEPQFLITYDVMGPQSFAVNSSDVTVTTAELSGTTFNDHLAEVTIFVRQGSCDVQAGQNGTPIQSVKMVYQDPQGNPLVTDFIDLVEGQATFMLDLYNMNGGNIPLRIRAKASGIAGTACAGFLKQEGILDTVNFPAVHNFN